MTTSETDFAGIRLVLSPAVPKGEVWIVPNLPPRFGETLAQHWARRGASSTRIINLGEADNSPQPL